MRSPNTTTNTPFKEKIINLIKTARKIYQETRLAIQSYLKNCKTKILTAKNKFKKDQLIPQQKRKKPRNINFHE